MFAFKLIILFLLTKPLVQGFSVPLHSLFHFLDEHGELALDEKPVVKSLIDIPEDAEDETPEGRSPMLVEKLIKKPKLRQDGVHLVFFPQ
ncbi:unnamed protein product [Dibothriocephalus latus]|uniref:Uncharacterized protein n=1 Tax=Dibothriocephalus latus TaxID=60516 RepID=A0A3P6U3X2_DIBLA|nr:unnamed protein product [Dibothriocephalus latus]